MGAPLRFLLPAGRCGNGQFEAFGLTVPLSGCLAVLIFLGVCKLELRFDEVTNFDELRGAIGLTIPLSGCLAVLVFLGVCKLEL